MPIVSGATFHDPETDTGVLRFEVTEVEVEDVEYLLDALECVVGVGIDADPYHERSHYTRPDLPKPVVGEETQALCGKVWVVQALGHEARYTRTRCPYCDSALRIADILGLRGAFAVRPEQAKSDELLLLVEQGVEAFRLTNEYVPLPEVEGWSHFDWTEAAKAALAMYGVSE